MSSFRGRWIGLLDDALAAGRATLRDLDDPEIPATLRRVAGYSGGKLPPRIVIHGSRTDTIPEAYRRYLANRFIRHFRLKGTPVFIEFRDSDNPYKNKKNVLTRRQLEKRKRLKKFTGRRSRR